MAGGMPQNRKTALLAIEAVMRKVTVTPAGPMAISKLHVRKACKSRKSEGLIGNRRADKVWAWVANAIATGAHRLTSPNQRAQHWMTDEEAHLLVARGAVAWEEEDPDSDKSVQRLEVVGAVRAWLEENEQQTDQGVILLRRPKLRALKEAKKSLVATRGGHQALLAAIVELSAQGSATLEQPPLRPSGRGEDQEWIQNAGVWMQETKWTADRDELAQILHKASITYQEHGNKKFKHLMVDIGEGWGSIGRAVHETHPDIQVVGLDRRGFTYTGMKHGVITAAVNHDYSIPQDDLRESRRRTLERKVGRSVKKWLLAWISAECTIWSQGNYMNTVKGAAHGNKALLPANVSAATPERLAEEARRMREATHALEYLIGFLEECPELQFALENPRLSDLWNTQIMRAARERNPGWNLTNVDQCAYGRQEKKPTCILHNIQQWTPRGITGNGRCRPGECAGTKGNPPGCKQHRKQIIPRTRDKRPDQGEMISGKREFTLKAVVNAVEAGLVQEITEAAKACHLSARGAAPKPPPGRARGAPQGTNQQTHL
jgi:hypothetical protein